MWFDFSSQLIKLFAAHDLWMLGLVNVNIVNVPAPEVFDLYQPIKVSGSACIWLIDFYFRLHLVFTLISIDIKKAAFFNLYFSKNFGDHLSMGTELVGDFLSREINQLGTHCTGPSVCGPYAFGTKCVTAFLSTLKNIKFSLDLIYWFLFSFVSCIHPYINSSFAIQSWECSIDIRKSALLNLYCWKK